jgi:hypothetical protein
VWVVAIAEQYQSNSTVVSSWYSPMSSNVIPTTLRNYSKLTAKIRKLSGCDIRTLQADKCSRIHTVVDQNEINNIDGRPA